jgi:aldose 1-epimerase
MLRTKVSEGCGGGAIRTYAYSGVGGDNAVEELALRNASGMEVRFIPYGGIITAITVPDRAGRFANVVLGYERLEDYLVDDSYTGALIGRYANRIGRSRFALDDITYLLPPNDGPNQLHGGRCGFHTKMWTIEPLMADERGGEAARLHCASPAGEEGFPGALDVRVTYRLTSDNALIVEYYAKPDAPTPVNLTQHSYFNLGGRGQTSILGHELTLGASRFTPVDATLIPTGELRATRGTPFDFSVPHTIGARMNVDDAQLRHGRGYDHNFVIDHEADGAIAFAARLHDPESGRVLDIHTTEPGIQLYSGNLLGRGLLASRGFAQTHSGLALETQHFPDSPNQPRFPTTIARPGHPYTSLTSYRFSSR